MLEITETPTANFDMFLLLFEPSVSRDDHSNRRKETRAHFSMSTSLGRAVNVTLDDTDSKIEYFSPTSADGGDAWVRANLSCGVP